MNENFSMFDGSKSELREERNFLELIKNRKKYGIDGKQYRLLVNTMLYEKIKGYAEKEENKHLFYYNEASKLCYDGIEILYEHDVYNEIKKNETTAYLIDFDKVRIFLEGKGVFFGYEDPSKNMCIENISLDDPF